MHFFDKRFFLILLAFGWMQQLSAEDGDKCPLLADKADCSFSATGDVNTITKEVEQCAKELAKKFDELDIKGTGQEKFEKWSACAKKLAKANQELNIAFDAEQPAKAGQVTKAQRQVSKTLDKAYSEARVWLIPSSAYNTALCRSTLASLRQLSFDIDKDSCEQQSPSCTEVKFDCEYEQSHAQSTQEYCQCLRLFDYGCCIESSCSSNQCN
ncbi:hypothetical protein [Candidatus Albibeggiatoa sp. nov. BB20]|uniref:hypothetical protein n=1 Tax=Candidatus Albibeggiatoa sp. nov. BB20 TaxID=3162723 RepID=UPI003365346E